MSRWSKAISTGPVDRPLTGDAASKAIVENWLPFPPQYSQYQELDEALSLFRLMKAEQSNTSIVYGEWLILKLLRRAEEGESLDLEIGRFLTEKSSFSITPPWPEPWNTARTRPAHNHWNSQRLYSQSRRCLEIYPGCLGPFL